MRCPGTLRVDPKLLMFIVHHHAEHGYGPTHREMAEAMGWPVGNLTMTAVYKLERAGLVTSTPGVARSLRPLVRETPLVVQS